jgi:PadR family transcriptional regulator AphA
MIIQKERFIFNGSFCTIHNVLYTIVMKKTTRTSISYIVLGMVASCGAATSYEINKLMEGSIGYFWPFPRTQVYLEPAQLVQQGLLEEEQEESGRRRHTYRITTEGRKVIEQWIGGDEGEPAQIRDTGLLKLYFAHLVPPEEVIRLANRQEYAHVCRLQEYELIQSQLADIPRAEYALATLRMGIAYEQESIRFWQHIATHPPQFSSNEPMDS